MFDRIACLQVVRTFEMTDFKLFDSAAVYQQSGFFLVRLIQPTGQIAGTDVFYLGEFGSDFFGDSLHAQRLIELGIATMLDLKKNGRDY